MGHFTNVFTEAFLKHYIRYHVPKPSKNLDKQISQLRSLVDEMEGVPKLPVSKIQSIINIQQFRNKLAHHQSNDPYWSSFNFLSVLSNCCDLYSYAEAHYNQERVDGGTSLALELIEYDLTSPEGFAQYSYDKMSEMYEDLDLFFMDGVWESMDHLEGRKEASDEFPELALSENEEDILDELEFIEECFTGAREILKKILSFYEHHPYEPSIEHNSKFSMEIPKIDNSSNKPKSEGESSNQMKARDIDENGNWDIGGDNKIALLGIKLKIPDNIIGNRAHPQRQEVIALGGASDIYDKCPECGAEVTGVILYTGWTNIFPSQCCNRFCYQVNDNDFENLFDA
jgi:hypothetical protein